MHKQYKCCRERERESLERLWRRIESHDNSQYLSCNNGNTLLRLTHSVKYRGAYLPPLMHLANADRCKFHPHVLTVQVWEQLK